MNRSTSGLYGWWREALGAIVVLLSRLAIAPRTWWEHDELLFAFSLRDWDPLRYHPHPPGFPLYVLLGKLVNIFVHDELRALVGISIAASVIGFLALARLFRALIDDADLAVVGALIVYFSAAMLIHSPLPLTDGPALAFTALTLLFIAKVGTDDHERAAILTGFFASCAIGIRPQLAVPLAPALLVALWQMRTRRERIASIIASGFTTMLWLLPQLDVIGGVDKYIAWQQRQVSYVATHDAAASRGMMSAAALATRFILHPWGSKYVTIPLLFFFAFGIYDFWKRRNARMLALVVFTLVQLAFELRAMDPADGARYAIPTLPLVALIVACGLGVIRRSAHMAAIPWLGALLLGGLSFWYVSPIIAQRTKSPSPPAAAADYANHNFAPNTVVLFEWSVRPHAEFLMSRFHPTQLEPGLREYYDRPDVPLVLFANGSSRAPDAKSFSWAPSDAYGKLTRNFYRTVTLDVIRPEERYLPLRGVHALERTIDGDEWRWLEQDAAIRLPHQHGSRAVLSLYLSKDAPYEATDVSVFVNGVQGAKVSVGKEKPTEATVALPPGDVELRIVSSRSFSPAEVLHNQDPRKLAVQLLRLETR
jgi:hypothetical protein